MYYRNYYQDKVTRPMTPLQKRYIFETLTLKQTCYNIGIGVMLIMLIMQITSALIFLMLTLLGYQNRANLADSFGGYNPNLYYLGVSFVTIFSMTFVIGIMLNLLDKSSNKYILQFKKTDIKLGSALFSLGILGCTLANITTSSISLFFSMFGFEISAPETPYKNTLFVILLLIITNCILPAILEEFVFRGIILSSLRRFGDAFAIMVSAVLFSLVHCNLVQIPFALIVGITLGFITIKTNSLLIPILVHFTNNFISCITVIISKELGDLASEIIYLSITLIIFCVGALALKYLLLEKRELFSLDDSTTILSFKRRCKIAITSPAIIISVVLALITTIIGAIE